MIQNSPVQGSYYSAPAYQAQPTAAAQPVSQVNAYASPDQYQMQYRPQQPQAQQAQGEKFSLVTSSDFKLGLLGAVGGFFAAGLIGVSGPIGALIFGVALLGLSIAIRGIKHLSAKKDQKAMAQQQVARPQFQQPAYNPLTYNATPHQNTYNYQYQPQPQQAPYTGQPAQGQPQVTGMPMQHQQYYNNQNQTRRVPDQNKSFLEKILYAL